MATTTTSPKLTKRDFFGALANHFAENPTAFTTEKGEISADKMAEFIAHEIDLLSKKNVGEKKPTAQQIANKGICDGITTYLASQPNRLFTIAEMMKEVPACEGLSSQRVTALVKLILDDTVERIEDKRKAYFRYLSK